MTKKERIAELERQVAELRGALTTLQALVWTLQQAQQVPTGPAMPTEPTDPYPDMPTYPHPYPWWVGPTITIPGDTGTITISGKDVPWTFVDGWPE